MELKEAIEVLKEIRTILIFGELAQAIDTVVKELEKDVIMEDKLMMILRQLYDHKINIIEAFN